MEWKTIATTYQKTTNYVITGNMRSEEFEIKDGMRQGGVLTPLLFNIILDEQRNYKYDIGTCYKWKSQRAHLMSTWSYMQKRRPTNKSKQMKWSA